MGLGPGTGKGSRSGAVPTGAGGGPARGGTGSSTVSTVSTVVVFRVVRRMKGETNGTGVFSVTATPSKPAAGPAQTLAEDGPGGCRGPPALSRFRLSWMCCARPEACRESPSGALTLCTVAACSGPVQKSAVFFLSRALGVARRGRALPPRVADGALGTAPDPRMALPRDPGPLSGMSATP